MPEMPDFAIADSCPLGKLNSEVKTNIPDETDELLTFLASAYRQKKSEYLRNLIIEHVHGRAEIVRLLIDRPLRSAR